MSTGSSETEIHDCWHRNAAAWTAAVRGGRIESRRLTTDRAVVDAILSRAPRSVIDIGCGEGWLARALVPHGIDVLGLDRVPRFIEQARQAGGGEFHLTSYEAIAAGKVNARADLAVCNFSLLGKESVETLFAAIPSLLNSGGSFVVQTLHPVAACGEFAYQDGWREGSWDGFGDEFIAPAPWYYRTLESWTGLFPDSGLRLCEMRVPKQPLSGTPLSVIFIAEPT